jgi:hypothetical protein
MKKTSKLVALAVPALAALAFTGSAFASFAPKLIVSGAATAGGPARVGVVVSNSDDPTAKTSIYVPSGYTVGTPAAGTKLGDVTATASAADLGGAVLPLTGELDAVAPTATTQAQAQACGVSPAQTWDLHLTAAGQTLDIPLFVVATAGPEATLGATKLVVCLPPPDVPTGTPGRATFGAKLLSATFTASAITEPTTAGDYRWTSLWTPYTPGKGTPNAAGSVETQSVRHLPVQLTTAVARKKVIVHKTKTVKVKVKGKTHSKKVRVAVKVTAVGFASAVGENGKVPSSVTYTTTLRGKKIGGAKGSFVMVGIKSVKLTATAVVDSDSGSVPTGQTAVATDLFFHDLGSTGCVASAIFGGLPCIDATVGGERLTKTVTVKGF